MVKIDPKNKQARAIMMALGASAIAAVATMFLPTALLEALTGATGLSELVPATAAPLGDTARAIIAFCTGAVTMVLVGAILLRKSSEYSVESASYAKPAVTARTEYAQSAQIHEERGVSLLDRVKTQIATKLPTLKMPWSKRDEAGVYDLSDLPRLRSVDSHPDAPARRPFSAEADLASWTAKPFSTPDNVADEAPVQVDTPVQVGTVAQSTSLFQAAITAPTAQAAPAVKEPAVHKVEAPPAMAPERAVVVDHGEETPSLTELVAQLEASISQREQTLFELERVAAELAKQQAEHILAKAVHAAEPIAAVTAEGEPAPMPPVNFAETEIFAPAEILTPERRPLEVVPSSPRNVQTDEMDSALNAALATLHRLNAKAG